MNEEYRKITDLLTSEKFGYTHDYVDCTECHRVMYERVDERYRIDVEIKMLTEISIIETSIVESRSEHVITYSSLPFKHKLFSDWMLRANNLIKQLNDLNNMVVNI